MTLPNLRPRLWLFSMTLLLLCNSCKVTLVAPRDSELLGQIETASQAIDGFYLKMLDATVRNYAQYSDGYIAIEVQLNAIHDKTRLKQHNAETVAIADNVRSTWVKYKNEHKAADKLNDGEIRYNSSTMRDFIYALSVAENAKPAD